ncbi:hypothetical protein [Fictibacillus sp. 7GRE50]|nr:hypothetical protein [Fictibacillus sp. 7GRE50]
MRHLNVKHSNVAHRLPRGKRTPVTETNTLNNQQSALNTFIKTIP